MGVDKTPKRFREGKWCAVTQVADTSVEAAAAAGLEPIAIEAFSSAAVVVAYAETVGLLGVSTEAGFTIERFIAALQALAAAGVARHVVPPHIPAPVKVLRRAAQLACDAIDVSPLPAVEWAPISFTLEALLPDLVGVSASSVARYRTGERSTPDAVAARLHTVTLIVSDLAGSYNEFGIRRWFLRSRQVLGGKAPTQVLVGDWGPDDPAVMEVRALAASLVGLGAA
jgi:hypothetical protein